MRASLQAAWADFSGVAPLRLAVVLTCPYLIYYVAGEVLVRQFELIPLAGTLVLGAIVGIAAKGGTATAGWALAAAAQAVNLVLNWQLVDNHVYLAFYWTLAIVVARSPRTALALVAMTMALAVLQKLRAGEYRDGRFFYFAFLTDLRFGFLTPLLGVDLTALADQNRAALGALKGDPTRGSVELLTAEPARLLAFARGFSWAVLLVEGASAVLAAAALASRRALPWAHAALVAFLAGTYTFVPVGGFGAVLSLLGLAATEQRAPGLKAAYVALLAYVLFFADGVRDLWTWALVG